jgi:hypothetical protein
VCLVTKAAWRHRNTASAPTGPPESGLRSAYANADVGFTRISAVDPATHDDVEDALMLATLPYSAGGPIVCGLTRFADRRRAVAEASGPELDEEIVETGEGLRLYRRPPFRSVVGPEAALPAGTTRPRKHVPRLRGLADRSGEAPSFDQVAAALAELAEEPKPVRQAGVMPTPERAAA